MTASLNNMQTNICLITSLIGVFRCTTSMTTANTDTTVVEGNWAELRGDPQPLTGSWDFFQHNLTNT